MTIASHSQPLPAVTLTITPQVIALYADLTNDYNPIHVDPEFAASTPLGGVIAHGTMSLALIWQAMAKVYGIEALAHATLDIRFTRPAGIGDQLTAGGEADLSAGSGHYQVWVRNQHGDDVIAGSASVAMP